MVTPTPSEFALFQRLANPQKTDFSKPALFKSAVKSQLGAGRVAKVVEERDDDSVSSKSSLSSRSSRSKSSYRSRDVPPPRGGTPPPPAPHVDHPDLSDSYAFGYTAAAPQPDDAHVEAQLHAEIEREKQGYLLELIKFKKNGHELTREYSMDDSLVDIQFEYDRIKNQVETTSNVAFLRDALMFSFQAVELANDKWGPVLELNGWSQEAAKDKEKYNRVIERLYKKHWRFGSMSPEAEFAWLIGSSMVGHHVKKKWGFGAPLGGGGGGGGGMNPMSMFASMAGMGGGGGARPSAVPMPPPTSSPVMAGGAQAAAPRPVMSRPVMRGPPSFTVPPTPPPPAGPPPPDPAMLVLQEQRREAEREVQTARAEIHSMQQQMAQQRAQMQAEFAKQQFAHHRQMEAMQAQVRGMVAPHPASEEREGVKLREIEEEEEEEESAVDVNGKEVSLVGVTTHTAPPPARRQTGLPALKLDL